MLVEDPRMRLLSFTGSPKVGWLLKSRAGQKRCVLELGSTRMQERADRILADPRIGQLFLGGGLEPTQAA